MVKLIRGGDKASLKELRSILGKTRAELAPLVGVSEEQLKEWENGGDSLSNFHHSRWKIVLSDCVDLEIAHLLGTDNTELITKFWELLWLLSYL